MKKRIRLTVAYDGTKYSGWQYQPNVPTIEGEINRAVKEVTGETIRVIGASRTDAGVHALCNTAVFDTDSRVPGDRFAYALNGHLPEDIRIMHSEETQPDFHPRHCSSRKTYEYRIYNAEMQDPTQRLYTLFSYQKYDIAAMQQAASALEGEHDFKSFCTVGAVVETTVRTLYHAEVEACGSMIIIRVQGNGFLYNMVRIIAGTLMEIGAGKRKPESIPEILEAQDRRAAGPTAPAHGLFLVKYDFE